MKESIFFPHSKEVFTPHLIEGNPLVGVRVLAAQQERDLEIVITVKNPC